MAIILFDNPSRNSLFPFTYTKAIADLRFGIVSIKERWEGVTGMPVFVHTEKYLQPLYPVPENGQHTWVDASVMITDELLDCILTIQPGESVADENGLIAGSSDILFEEFNAADFLERFQDIHDNATAKRLEHPWQLMQWNDEMIRADYKWVTKGRSSQPLPPGVNTLEPGNIFIEVGAKLNFCTLNAATGPIYIGKHAEIMEGSVIRGPFVLGDNSVVKMNSRIYGATTLGPFCMGGGEIKNAVMMGYSNKAHDGYLGDSVVGEWCNFGAGSTNSNIKNTAGEVKIWDMASKNYVAVGQKCGVIMGDYSRLAINSSVNTGTMIGVSCNVFGAGLLPTIVDNFSWGVGGIKYELSKAIEAIGNWKKLKQSILTKEQATVLTHIFENHK
jgi:UDP-N-acetylglucosamine diphosphorylase/glucosamine-1-phosphate N-acetyltransferase